MLVEIDIMKSKQFVLDLNKKIDFISSYSCLFDLDIKIT